MFQIPARKIAVAEEVYEVSDRFDRIHRKKRFRNAPDLLRVLICKKQRGAAFIDDSAAVHPIRQFVEHLVVRIVFIPLLHLFAVLFAHRVIVRRIRVDRSKRRHGTVRKNLQPFRGKRQRKRGQRFAAIQIETVIGGKLLLCLRALFLRGGSNGREQNRIVIFPKIARFLTEIGQLTECTVIQPKPAFIAVFLFIAV